jgi:NAD(P)-dependent dehydrogenase (short-subunit alcohol dehydrogenase family)
VTFPSFDLTGRKALVTGGSRGIGRHAALTLANAGCDLAISGRDRAALDETAEQAGAMGRLVHVLEADLADTGAAVAMAREADRLLGGVDILLNNAGVSFPESALETTQEGWDATLDINLKAPLFIAQQVVPGMIARGGGKIIMLCSAAGIVGLADHAAYCASKGGMVLLTKVLAIEWARHNIQVNAIAPTVILTPMGETVWGAPEKRDPMIAKIPAGRFGMPVEVSGAVVFLASPASDFINGETLAIDGGYTAQ